MQSIHTDLALQLQEILNDPAGLNNTFLILRRDLIQKYPGKDGYWYDFWATRLAVLSQGTGDVALTMGPDDDEATIDMVNLLSS